MGLFCFLLLFFCFSLHCFAFSVVCPAFAAAFGSPTVEKPTVAAFDLPKMSITILQLISSPLLAKSQEPIVIKIHWYLKKKAWKNRNSTGRRQ